MDPNIKVLSATDPSDVSAACAAAGLTDVELAELRTAALAAREKAYCPYSKFRVGAALLTSGASGSVVVTGANVENASYPVGTCAERVAFGRAVVDGHRSFRAVAVATDLSGPCSPCGMCRQLYVFFSPPYFSSFFLGGGGCRLACCAPSPLPRRICTSFF